MELTLRQKTCCFTGHRSLPKGKKEDIRQALETEILKLVDSGVVNYGCGGAIGYDLLCAEVILKLKKDNPKIKLIMVIPCKNQDKLWDKADKEFYASVLKAADKVKILRDDYTPNCMNERNQKLVDGSGACLCYLTQRYGGTYNTVRMAKRDNLKVINIADLI